jgi:hypothetical protein
MSIIINIINNIIPNFNYQVDPILGFVLDGIVFLFIITFVITAIKQLFRS